MIYIVRKFYFVPAAAIGSLFFLCIGCKHSVEDPSWINPLPVFSDSLTLQFVTSKTFILDSMTVLKNENFQYQEKMNSVISYNSTNSELLFYNYNTGELTWKIDLKALKIRPHNKGDMKSYSFHVSNSDSIYFYDHARSKVLLFDTSGKIKKEYSVASKENGHAEGGIVLGEGLVVSRDSIYIPSAPGRNPGLLNAPLRSNLILSISIKDGNTKLHISYPELYKKAIWGYYFHLFYCAYSDKLKRLLISYPVDHYLSTFDTTDQDSKYYAGSKDVVKVIPLRFAGNSSTIKKQEEVINFTSQKSYRGIYYDQYRNLYYRLVSAAIPKKDFEISKAPAYKREPMALIILDAGLKKVGEVSIDANKYSTISMFISREGICLPLKKSNDDASYFDIFEITKK